MTLPTWSRSQAVAVISITVTFFSASSLAFSPTPTTTRLCSRHGFHRHEQATLVAAATNGGGHDDWQLEEEGNSDNKLHISEKPSTTATAAVGDNDGKKDEDIRTYFATCIPGLQETLASELIGLGADHVEPQGKSGVRFEGSPEVGLKSVLWCRTAHKIMELIAASSEPPSVDLDFDYAHDSDFSQGIRNREDLYQFTKSAVHTPTLLGDGGGGLLTLSVSTIYASKAPNKDLCHGHFTALTVKNALVDSVRDMRDGGDRPNVDTEDPDVPLVVVIKGRRVGGDDKEEWRDRKGRSRYEETSHEEAEYVADVDLYRCLHSGSLHRRGYRQANLDSGGWEDEEDDHGDRRPQSNGEAPIHRAAMKESLAAGLLLEAGWDKLVSAARGDGKGAVLVDPMTGSATMPTEAALIACDMAPGLSRISSWRGHDRNIHRFPPCTRWKDFSNTDVWAELLAKAGKRAKSGMKWANSLSENGDHSNVKILCNEMNPRAHSLARTSISNAGVRSIVSLSEGDCMGWDLGGGEDSTNDRNVVVGRTIFVCNPPWGLRLTEDIDESWVSLREFFRREAGGCESWVLSGNKQLTHILRMKKSRTVVLKTADEDLRWLQYHIFEKKKEIVHAE